MDLFNLQQIFTLFYAANYIILPQKGYYIMLLTKEYFIDSIY